MQKKNTLALFGLAALTLGMALPFTLHHLVKEVATPVEADSRVYYMQDFEGILAEDETSHDCATWKNSVGMFFTGDSHTFIEKDETNSYVSFKNGGQPFANLCLLFNDHLGYEGDLEVSFDVKLGAGHVSTDNVGFRLYSAAAGHDSENLSEQVNAANTTSWTKVSTIYHVDAEQAASTMDSVQMWVNVATAEFFIDNFTIKFVNETVNIFPSPGFDNMLNRGEAEHVLSGTTKNGLGSVNTKVSIKQEGYDGRENNYLNIKWETQADSFVRFFSFLTANPSEANSVYILSMDVRAKDAAFTTDNFAAVFYTSDATLDEIQLASHLTDLTPNVWKHISVEKTFSADEIAAGVKTFDIWLNTNKQEANSLDIDNICISKKTAADDAPQFVGGSTATFKCETPADVSFEVDLHGKELLSMADENELELIYEIDYVLEGTTLTIKSDYLLELGAGTHSFTITTEAGQATCMVTVIAAPKVIPSAEDYTMVDTLLGGDFESYDIGRAFSEDQTEEAWGSLAALDDPGVITDDNGNHVLAIGRKEGSVKTYSSAFAMLSPSIAVDDILTFEFDYKIVSNNPAALTGTDTNVCFVGGTNTSYHLVKLTGEKNTPTIEGNVDEYPWPVTYSESTLEGYTHVKVDFMVTFAFLNSTNSVRFLHKIVDNDTKIYIDNVKLVQWQDQASDETPTVSPAEATFDLANPNDLKFAVELHDYNISSIKLNGTTISSSNYSLSEDEKTLTVKKEYLSTLAVGDHSFTLNTIAGSASFKVTVTGEVAPDTPETPTTNPVNPLPIILGVVGGVVVLGGAAVVIVIVLKKKRSK